MLLFRPTGLKELQLVYESGMRAWPPRLPEQPIFYPVLNFDYAAQIARDWNAKSPPFAGYVTEFPVEDAYISQFERQVVGARQHEELWIPAEQLAEMNRHIEGRIRVKGSFFGENFVGHIPHSGKLQGQNARDQFTSLASLLAENLTDFQQEIRTNHIALFLHFAFWKHQNYEDAAGISRPDQERVLERIRTAWNSHFPDIRLPA